MTVNEFISLCKTKIGLYLNNQTEYSIYTIWKDYWTVGQTGDSVSSIDNQRAIFGNTLNDKYFDCTYNALEDKLYMKVYDIDDTEEYTLNSNV